MHEADAFYLCFKYENLYMKVPLAFRNRLIFNYLMILKIQL